MKTLQVTGLDYGRGNQKYHRRTVESLVTKRSTLYSHTSLAENILYVVPTVNIMELKAKMLYSLQQFRIAYFEVSAWPKIDLKCLKYRPRK